MANRMVVCLSLMMMQRGVNPFADSRSPRRARAPGTYEGS